MKLSGKTILLVEDEAITALTEEQWLKGEGLNVIHVTNGLNAINAVEKNPESIDLILMDIDLGSGMDGTEAAREILKEHDIPLLFLSSHTEKNIVDKTEEITSYGYVVKGSDDTVLLASIKMAFKLFQQKKETLIQETKLYETAENLAITLESIGDGVITTDTNGCITRMNQVAEHLCGWKAEEADGRPLCEVFNIINAKTHKKADDPIGRVLESGKRIGLSNHTVLVSKDGSEYYIVDSAAPIRNNSGKILGVVIVFADVTEKYKKEERLRESEEHFKNLFENAPLGYQSLDENGCLIDVNQTWLETLGYGRDEVIGRWFGDFLVPQMVDLFRERFPIFKARGAVHTEYELIRKNGTIANIIFDGRIGHTANGKFMQTHCILQDVTGFRKAERNMFSIEERYKLLYENSMDAIFFASPTGIVISANPAACRMFGMTEDEIIKRGRYGLIDPADFRHSEALKERTKNGRFAGELDWIKMDGTKFTGEVSSVIFNDPESHKRTCTIIRDVTGRKLAEEQMKSNNEELIRLSAIKDKSLAIISHDLRGPFQGFLGLTKDLADNIEKLEQQEISEIASVMHQSAKETYSLLTNLQEWSRIQTGRFNFSPIELNLFLEVENIQKLFQSVVVLKSLILENNVDKDIFVKTDENALSTILRNLIDNAIKFTREGGKVSVSSIKRENFVEISVYDSGIGIDKAKLEVLLGPYSGYTTRGTNGEKGSGLGLQLCRDLVEKCGGTMRVNSETGTGTEFIFTMPL